MQLGADLLLQGQALTAQCPRTFDKVKIKCPWVWTFNSDFQSEQRVSFPIPDFEFLIYSSLNLGFRTERILWKSKIQKLLLSCVFWPVSAVVKVSSTIALTLGRLIWFLAAFWVSSYWYKLYFSSLEFLRIAETIFFLKTCDYISQEATKISTLYAVNSQYPPNLFSPFIFYLCSNHRNEFLQFHEL